MAIAGKQRAGKNARISANGTNLNYGKFDCNDKADKIDTTNFESTGQGQGTTGVETIEHSGSGLWDAGRNAFDSPPGIYPQDSFPNLKYYLNQTDNTFWNFPLALILSASNGAEVRGAVQFSWSGESNGPFNRPTGSV